ncbi:hypothetical protein Tco_0710523 [Tanacetum coccineum]
MLEKNLVQQDLNQVVKIPQVIVDEQLVLDMIVDEQLVLHMLVVVEDVNRIVVVEELLKIIDCTDVVIVVEWRLHVALDMHIADQSSHCAYPLLISHM